MTDTVSQRPDLLEARLARGVAINWEMAGWILIVVATLVTRLWDLGDRAMSHDESLHTYYSWKLFMGRGYAHDPMMHGPLLYHVTALFYYLFGASDFTSRLLGVTSGLGLVLSPLLVRRWLGSVGALSAALVLLVSPTIMYYSRYIRHDIPVELFTVLMFVSFIRYIDRREGRWIVTAFAAAAGAITSAEMSYINGFVLVLFIVLALAAERLGPRLADMLAIVVSAIGLGLLTFAVAAHEGAFGPLNPESALHVPMQLSFMLGGLGLIYGVTLGLFSRFPSSADHDGDLTPPEDGAVLADLLPQRYFQRFAETAVAAQMIVGGLAMLVTGVLLGRWVTNAALSEGIAKEVANATPSLLVALGAAFVFFGVGGMLYKALGSSVNLVLIAAGGMTAAVFAVIAVRLSSPEAPVLPIEMGQAVYASVLALVVCLYGLLGWALGDASERSLARAMAAAPVASLGAALAVFAVIYALLFTTFFTEPAKITGFVDSVRYWLEQHDVQRGGQPWYYYGLLLPMYEFLALFLAVAGVAVYMLRPDLRVGRGNRGTVDAPSPAAKLFVPMLIAWAAANAWIYSWAGEKMPWLLVHLVVPLAFLAGRFVSDVVGAVDWAEQRRSGWLVGGAGLLVLVVLASLLAMPRGEPTTGLRSWMIAIPVVAVLVLAIVPAARRMGIRQAQLSLALVLLVALFVVNTRYSLMANFVNDELANEYIVYAHGTPDDKLVYNTLLDMQERLGVERPLKLGYDNEVSWPFTWYFRDTDWHQADYLAENAANVRDHDVVLIGDPNYDDFHPYLRDRYVWVDYRRMWWPNEGYKNLTLDTFLENLTDSNLRRNWIDILLHRYYRTDPRDPNSEPKPLTEWYHQANMRMYVRKDLIERVWPLVEGRPDWAIGVSTSRVDVASVELGMEIRLGEGAGQPIVSPKDVAVGDDGMIYVLDHGNGRVVVFDEDGTYDSHFGSFRDAGGVPTAWGIGLGPNGAVYVADTWNHQIVKFVDGEEETRWGSYEIHKDTPKEGLTQFFGPRDVAVDGDGNVWITDTGNSRLIKFDPNGRPLDSFGSEGIEAGQFREPVSVAFDPATGDMLVADLWNFRIQRFDANLRQTGQWLVDGWDLNVAADDKAYLAVGPGSTVIASDPLGKRVWIYSSEGEALATLDVLNDATGLDKPIGVAVDSEGRVYVAASQTGVVSRYGAPDAILDATGGSAEDDDAGEDAAEASDEPSPTDAAEPSPTGDGGGPAPTEGEVEAPEGPAEPPATEP